MRISVKRKLAIGMIVLAAAAFAGGAYAAAQDSGATAQQAFLNDVAKRLDVTPEQLSAALEGAYLDQVQAAVAADKLTRSQANAIKQRVQQSGGVPLGGWRSLGPFARGGPFPGPHSFGIAPLVGAAAADLGLSRTQLADELRSGKSLARIAQARGKSVTALKDAVTSAERSRLERLVASKVITRAQEQRILSNLPARLDNEIDRTGDGRGFGLDPMSRDDAGTSAVQSLFGPPGGSAAAAGRPAAAGAAY